MPCSLAKMKKNNNQYCRKHKEIETTFLTENFGDYNKNINKLHNFCISKLQFQIILRKYKNLAIKKNKDVATRLFISVTQL